MGFAKDHCCYCKRKVLDLVTVSGRMTFSMHSAPILLKIIILITPNYFFDSHRHPLQSPFRLHFHCHLLQHHALTRKVGMIRMAMIVRGSW